MERRTVLLGGIATVLAGCSEFAVDYDAGLDPRITKTWALQRVDVETPDRLTISEKNSYAPDADIVWHGEDFGDRRAQVTRIFEEGVTAGGRVLSGSRPVVIGIRVEQFHGVTPISLARAPTAVHNIGYFTQVFDAKTGQPLTKQQFIQADLEAFVGPAAVAAAVEGRTQRVRIVEHLARVTRGWLGRGSDQRRSFTALGR